MSIQGHKRETLFSNYILFSRFIPISRFKGSREPQNHSCAAKWSVVELREDHHHHHYHQVFLFTRNHQSESLVSSLKWPLCNSDSPSPLVSSSISTSYSSDFVQNNYSWWSWWWIYINFPALNKDPCFPIHCAHILQAIDAVRLFLTWSHLKLLN